MGGTSVRTTFEEAAAALVETVARVPGSAWDATALGVWTVRDLVGHAGRALTTVSSYLATPAPSCEVVDAVDYFGRAKGAGTAEQVAERGRQAGRALGDAPLEVIRRQRDEAVTALAAAAPDAIVATPFGGMRIDDYLPTRIFELTVHTLDLQRALGIPTAVPASALRDTVVLTGELAALSGGAADAVLALTGRGPLPAGYTVL